MRNKITFLNLPKKGVLVILFPLLAISLNAQDKGLLTTKLFASLPDYCPTPDAFAIAPDGSLTLSCPNYAAKEIPGIIVKLSKDGEVSKLFEIPRIKPNTIARPMGLDYAPDGSLYVCANPRVLRITYQDGSIQNIDVIATGINGPNGLKIYDNALYVTTPLLPGFSTEKNTGGVYRFNLTDRNIEIKGDSSDPNLIFTVQTQNPKRQFGLDGLVFDNSGNLLIGDFGDGIIYKLKISEYGAVESQEIYVSLPDSTGIDGMAMDDDGNLFVAGFSQNQIFKIDTNQNVEILAQYPDNDGAEGGLDQPADLIVYNGKLIISNFDLMVEKGMINSKHSKPYTISYIDLKE